MSIRRRMPGFAALVLLLAAAVGGCLANQPAVEADFGAEGLPPYGVLTTAQAAQVIAMLQGHPEFLLLDIRTPAEVDAGHISGALELDFYGASFREQLAELDRDMIYLIYCRTGNRTGQTMDIMADLGFEQVYDMGGGIAQWIAAGHPVCVGPVDAEHNCFGGLSALVEG